MPLLVVPADGAAAAAAAVLAAAGTAAVAVATDVAAAAAAGLFLLSLRSKELFIIRGRLVAMGHFRSFPKWATRVYITRLCCPLQFLPNVFPVVVSSVSSSNSRATARTLATPIFFLQRTQKKKMKHESSRHALPPPPSPPNAYACPTLSFGHTCIAPNITTAR